MMKNIKITAIVLLLWAFDFIILLFSNANFQHEYDNYS